MWRFSLKRKADILPIGGEGRKEIGTVRNGEVKKMYLSYFIIGYSLVFIVKNVNIYEFNFVRL